MSFASIEEDVKRLIFDNWDIGNPVTPSPIIIIENRAEDTPDDVINGYYAELYIVFGESTPASVLDGTEEGVGQIVFTINIPLHAGKKIGLDLAWHIRNIIKHKVFDNAWTSVLSILHQAKKDENHYQIITTTPLYTRFCG